MDLQSLLRWVVMIVWSAYCLTTVVLVLNGGALAAEADEQTNARRRMSAD
jgi:hypothetical protein